MNNDRLECRKALIEDDNINISKTGDGKQFFILSGGVIGILLVIIMSFGFISDIFISCMSNETQMKIENVINQDFRYYKPELEYKSELKRLDKIKRRIIDNDDSLEGKSSFPIIIKHDNSVNACIAPNGMIFITTETLKQKFSNEELTFILAHEIGHYAHRDHLRTVSRQILIGSILGILGSQSNSLSHLLSGVTDMEHLMHSREQERNADKYAGEMLIKMYGSNKGGISFINKIKEKENTPEFMYYFSSHPSWEERLQILKAQ